MKWFGTWVGLLLLVCSSAVAQEDARRKWGVNFQVGGIMPTHPKAGRNGMLPMGSQENQSGLLTKLHFEYYIPQYPLSVKGGYEHEEVNLLGSDVSFDMKQMMLGGRYYPVPKDWLVQPYLGIDTYWNIGPQQETLRMKASSSQYGTYTRQGTIRKPLFSGAPVVGVDLYFFSCIAFQVEYGFRMGVGKSTEITSRSTSNSTEYYTTQRPFRHSFTVGLKISFPFYFTEDDGSKLIGGILDCIFY